MRRASLRVGALVAASLILVGCAQGQDYDDETAAALQSRVLAVSEAAAAADFPTTQARIDELRAAADDALARGDITDARRQSITSALDLVQADITAAVEEQERVAAELAAQQAEEARLAEEARVAEEARAAEEARLIAEQEAAKDDDKGKDKGKDKDRDEDD